MAPLRGDSYAESGLHAYGVPYHKWNLEKGVDAICQFIIVQLK